jgi:hypothetical protein
MAIRSVIGPMKVRKIKEVKETVKKINEIKETTFKVKTTRTRRSPLVSWKRSPRGRPVPRDFPLSKWKTIEPD